MYKDVAICYTILVNPCILIEKNNNNNPKHHQSPPPIKETKYQPYSNFKKKKKSNHNWQLLDFVEGTAILCACFQDYATMAFRDYYWNS